VTSPNAPEQDVTRVSAFVTVLFERYSAYHDHKETMAYAGFTLYLAVVGAGLFSDAWPPPSRAVWSPFAVLLVWALALTFLKFQLLRRRWAALRQAGCERLLARWISRSPTKADLELWVAQQRNRVPFATRAADWLVGHRSAVTAVYPDQTVYPRALVEEWQAREREGTDAIRHERLILVTGWLCFGALLWRTCAAS